MRQAIQQCARECLVICECLSPLCEGSGCSSGSGCRARGAGNDLEEQIRLFVFEGQMLQFIHDQELRSEGDAIEVFLQLVLRVRGCDFGAPVAKLKS